MATNEQIVLDGLALNDFTNFRLQDFDPGIAPKRWQWISGTDADGAILPEEARYENAEMTLRIRITPQTTMDAALAKIGQIVDKLQECEQQELGLAATWTPNNSTKTLTAYILGGEITGIPITMSGDDAGWFLRNPSPVVVLKLYRHPFLYGTEVTNAATVTNTDPIQVLTVSSVTGDVSAEARVVVTDNATQSRRYAEVGAAWRYTPPSTILDSDGLVTSGFAGAGTTRTGAYDPGAAGNNVIRATLVSSPVAVCGTGVLTHVGSYRVSARVYATSTLNTQTYVRLSWQEGDGPLYANTYVNPVIANNWSKIDLGMISIPEKLLGTQKWLGRIEAYTTGTAGTDTLDVDFIELIPVDNGYGKARAAYTYSPGVVNARDEFTGIAAATVLNARVAPVGGTWATSGAATDFIAADAPGTDETESRTTTADAAGGRFAILGATNYTDTEPRIGIYRSAEPGSGSTFYQGAIARWTDASNHLRVVMEAGPTADYHVFRVSKVVAGVTTTLASVQYSHALSTWYYVRVVITTSGAGTAYLTDTSGNIATSLNFQDAVLATGGTLATGKPGFVDYNNSGTAITRYYDNFTHSTPSAEPIVVYSGRAAEFRHDSAIRQDSTGTYYGPVPSYRGAHFFLQPAGDENRPNTITLKARRNDVDVGPDDNIADSTTVAVHYRPRWLAVPR